MHITMPSYMVTYKEKDISYKGHMAWTWLDEMCPCGFLRHNQHQRFLKFLEGWSFSRGGEFMTHCYIVHPTSGGTGRSPWVDRRYLSFWFVTWWFPFISLVYVRIVLHWWTGHSGCLQSTSWPSRSRLYCILNKHWTQPGHLTGPTSPTILIA